MAYAGYLVFSFVVLSSVYECRKEIRRTAKDTCVCEVDDYRLCFEMLKNKVQCFEDYTPENCDLNKIPLLTVEDFERCAPAQLNFTVRNYYLGRSGRGITYRENREAFQRINIRPKMLVDISDNSLEITTLGRRIAFPVGTSPSALHALAHPEGENATARAVASMNVIMIVSSIASIRLEEVAANVEGTSTTLWMQTYLFGNRSYTIDIVKRAERSGYKAIVVTVDAPIEPPITCNAKEDPFIANYPVANLPPETFLSIRTSISTEKDVRWLKSITKLPIVVKGILTGEDARRVILAGASAVLVSNHGGRQLDSVQATIEALPEVVRAVNQMIPRRDVYLDGGVRNGFDVYKALARGAKMVFIGRPVLWGLTLGGEDGVRKVLTILRDEFNTTMLLAGASNPSKIEVNSGIPSSPNLPKNLTPNLLLNLPKNLTPDLALNLPG